ncbi:MAG: hypothetical protein RL141_538 [Candidatus Parcubacteria bacterium]|jgi:N utilization substance protein A
MASPISQAIKQICDEKNIPYESVLETIEAALSAAYRKDFGNKNQNIDVEFDPEKYDGASGGIRVFDVKAVVEDVELPDDYFVRFDQSSIAKRQESLRPFPAKPVVTSAAPAAVDGATPASEEEEFVFNPKTMIMLSDARDVKPDAVVGEEIRVELAIPAAFGRMAAQTAKQVIMQKLREAERGIIYSDFKEREGELMNVTVQRREGRIVLIDLGRATGILLPEDQIDAERYYPGTRIKALLREVALTPKGPEIRLSRSHPDLVVALFMQEIPEVANGIVQLKDISREAGSRTKVAVTTNDDAIDPIGSCIGQRGTRIQSVIRELGGEKVDVILWSEDPATYIAASLSPAKVTNVELNRDTHLASVSVPSDQLSLAIGKGGQNVRLAAKLTGWKITIAEDGGSTVADSDVGEFGGASAAPAADEGVTPVVEAPNVATAEAPVMADVLSALDEANDKAERASEADAKNAG